MRPVPFGQKMSNLTRPYWTTGNKILIGKNKHGANKQRIKPRKKRTTRSANIKNRSYVKQYKIAVSLTYIRKEHTPVY